MFLIKLFFIKLFLIKYYIIMVYNLFLEGQNIKDILNFEIDYEYITCINYILFPLLTGYCIKYFFQFEFIICYFFGFLTQSIIFLNVNPLPISMCDKFSILKCIPEKYLPVQQYSLCEIKNKNIIFPIIIKPFCCPGCGRNITIIYSYKEFKLFIKNILRPEIYMVQQYLEDYNIELGILYEKLPWEKNGKITEITEKTNYTDKIRNYSKEHIKNHPEYLNNKNLNKIFNKLNENIPYLNAIRYDIRLKNIDDLEKDNFKIVEINGATGYSLQENPTKFHDYLNDTQWYIKRLIIGINNIITLKGYSILMLPIVICKCVYKSIYCIDYEQILSNNF